MSRATPNSSYMPDPNGWIETAPPSSTRSKPRKAQRPLMSLSHGLATPVSSGYKRSSNSTTGGGPGPQSAASIKKRLGMSENDSPSTYAGRGRQVTLNAFLTPPTTGSRLTFGREDARETNGTSNRSRIDSARTPLSVRGSPASSRAPPMFGGKGKTMDSAVPIPTPRGKPPARIHVFQDEFWGSSSSSDREGDEQSDGEKGRRVKAQKPDRNGKLPALQDHERVKRSAQKPTAIVDLTEDDDEPVSTRLRTSPRESKVAKHDAYRTPMTKERHPAYSSPLKNDTKVTPVQPSSLPYTSPPPPITPIPDYILHNHAQVCGHDPEQMKKIKSPWRKDRSPPPIRLPHAQAKDTTPEPPAHSGTKRKRAVSPKEEIDRRVWEAAHEKRHATPMSEKKLVTLSSSDPPECGIDEGKKLVELTSSDPIDEPDTPSKTRKMSKPRSRKPLTPLKTNKAMLGKMVSSSMIGRKTPPSSASRRRATRTVSPKISRRSHHATPPPRAAVANPLSVPPRRPIEPERADRYETPFIDIAPDQIEEKIEEVISQARDNEARLEQSLRDLGKVASQASQRSQRPMPNSPAIPNQPAKPLSHEPTSSPHLLLTPRKASPSRHHQVTPPKNHFRPMSGRQETLFVLPDSRAQPDFEAPSRSSSPESRAWQPADMDPETLVTWGLGGGETCEPLPPSEPDFLFGDDDEVEAGRGGPAEHRNVDTGPELPHERLDSQSPEPPLFSDAESPVHPERPSLAPHWSSKSIEATAFSQDFPVLIPTSSDGERGSSPPPRRQPTSRRRKVASADTRARPSTSGLTASLGPSKWDALSRGILAPTPKRESVPAGSVLSPSSAPERKRKSPASVIGQAEQSKLASFGFFGDRSRRRKSSRDLEKEWEEEENHHFEEDELPRRSVLTGTQAITAEATPRKLGKVPAAPYHPSLRPAGVRELERRAKNAAGRDDYRRSESKEGQQSLTRGRKDAAYERGDLMDERDDAEGPLFPASSSTGPTSSSQSGSGARTPGSTKDWWEGLEQRRGSEFGTMD
ncbi:hypothetical protein IAU60_003908 [Kwoniella sp. DSM 27419]